MERKYVKWIVLASVLWFIAGMVTMNTILSDSHKKEIEAACIRGEQAGFSEGVKFSNDLYKRILADSVLLKYLGEEIR